ncbi:MAG: NAD-dependent dehydratase [Hydrogenophaga sp.]
MTTLLLLGATGLVGGCALKQALAERGITRVVAPTRKPLPSHARLHNPQIDFDRLPESADWWRVDAVVCALGTTMAKAGSREAFRRVDHGIALQVARLALAHGARAFALNAALGADPDSRVFYSRTKGELERDLQTLGYPSLTFVRPGLIGGDRQESRPAERLGIVVSEWLRPLLPARYRVVPAERIAHHLILAALAVRPGVHVVPSEAIR